MNSLPSSALVPTISGILCAVPCFIASNGSSGRKSSPHVGPTGAAPIMESMLVVITTSHARTRSAGRALSSAAAALSRLTPSSSINLPANSAAISGVPTIPDAGLSAIAWAKRPFASGTASRVATACAPALSPKIVTLSGSPPKVAMFSRTHPRAATRSRRKRLLSIVASRVDSDDRSKHPSAPRR